MGTVGFVWFAASLSATLLPVWAGLGLPAAHLSELMIRRPVWHMMRCKRTDEQQSQTRLNRETARVAAPALSMSPVALSLRPTPSLPAPTTMVCILSKTGHCVARGPALQGQWLTACHTPPTRPPASTLTLVARALSGVLVAVQKVVFFVENHSPPGRHPRCCHDGVIVVSAEHNGER